MNRNDANSAGAKFAQGGKSNAMAAKDSPSNSDRGSSLDPSAEEIRRWGNAAIKAMAARVVAHASCANESQRR